MAFFWQKRDNVQQMLADYFEQCDACYKLFEKSFKTYLEMGHGSTFEASVHKTHEAESAADDLRREIEYTLYGKALLPESRGDLLTLLETFDRLPNAAETILFALRCQNIRIPDYLQQEYQALVEANLKAYYLARKAVDNLFDNPRITLRSTKEVDEKESAADRIERDLVCAIFADDMDTGHKILLRDLAQLIGKIADRAESAADCIGIIAIKRQI